MLRTQVAVLVGALIASNVFASQAAAESPVTIQSSGPERFAATTGKPTGRVVATFEITDASLTATGARICRILPEGTKRGCRYQRFDLVELDDDDWDDDWDDIEPEYADWTITGAPGSWTVGYPIGYEDIPPEECLVSYFNKNPFKASIEVMNDAGTVLASGNQNYRVACTGIAGNSTGPDRTRVYSGKSSKSQGLAFLVLDTKFTLDSYRACQYNSISGRYYACERKELKRSGKQKRDYGWVLSYNLTWRPMGSSLCSYIARKWPQAGVRVEFYDARMRKELTLFRGTRLTC